MIQERNSARAAASRQSPWLTLAAAIVCEVTATLALKGAVVTPALYVIVVLGYIASFVFLAATLRRGMALGVAYGVWGALGVALTAAAATVFFGEQLTPLMMVGMACVVAGVLLVELGSPKDHHGIQAGAQ